MIELAADNLADIIAQRNRAGAILGAKLVR
jgi:hypothetical protein